MGLYFYFLYSNVIELKSIMCKNKMKKLWLLVLVLMLVSCTNTKIQEDLDKTSNSDLVQEVSLNQEFELEEGQSVIVKGKNIKITLENLEKPFGEGAHFAGIASLNAEMTDGKKENFQFQLENTPEYNYKINDMVITFQGYSHWNSKINLVIS